MRNTCIEPDCSKPVVSNGWYNTHYARQKRAGFRTKKCVEDGCDGFGIAHGLCDKHYQRARQEGRFTEVKCPIELCGRPATLNGFCKKHGDRIVKYGLTPEQLTALDVGSPCAVSGEFSTNLSVDHCHESNTVRGFITNKINMALGLLDHDPVLLRKCADYLEDFKRRMDAGDVTPIKRRGRIK